LNTNSAGIAKLVIKVALLRLGFPAPKAIPKMIARTRAMMIYKVRGIRFNQEIALILFMVDNIVYLSLIEHHLSGEKFRIVRGHCGEKLLSCYCILIF
jgi:hypothetical protein